GVTRHVGVAARVRRDPVGVIIAAAAKVAGVDEGGARRIELRDKSVAPVGIAGAAPAGGGLKGPCGRREVRGLSLTRNISVAGPVHGDPIGLVIAAAAEISGKDEG